MNAYTGSIFDEFTKQYQLSKTLRFELKPVGKTAEWIKQNNIISVENNELIGVDAVRAQNYKYLKRIIDQMHRIFMQEALCNLEQDYAVELSDKIIALFKEKDFDLKKDKDLPKILEKIFDSKAEEWIKFYKIDMPKFWQEDIAKLNQEKELLSNNQDIKKKDNLIKKIEKKITTCKISAKGIKIMHSNEDTLNFLEWQVRLDNIHLTWKDIDYNDSNELIPNTELIKFIHSFDRFTTYFSGFNENRANIYDLKDLKSTSILYRTFEQNMRFHFTNIEKWEQVKKSIKKYEEIYNTKEYHWQKELEQYQINLDFSVEKFFVPESFVNYLSQSGINKYNQILGGLPELEGKRKVQGLNEYINLTRQQANAKRGEFPPLQKLYKQILSKSDSVFIEEFSNDKELFDAVKLFYKENFQIKEDNEKSLICSFAEKMTQMVNDYSSEGEFDKLFLDKDNISKISHELTGNWAAINTQLIDVIGDNKIEKQKVFSFQEIEQALKEGVKHDVFTLKFSSDTSVVLKYCLEHLKELLNNAYKAWNELQVNGLLTRSQIDKNRINETDKGFTEIALLKSFLDAANEIAFYMRMWSLKNKPSFEINEDWYSSINDFLHNYNVISIYNMTRNHVCKKAYSTDKIKINFNHNTLLDGWDRNKESANRSIIFEKNELFYLGIMTENSNTIFDYDILPGDTKKKKTIKQDLFSKVIASESESSYRKMNYKLLPGPNKMLPKVFFAKSNLNVFQPSSKIIDIKEKKLYSKAMIEEFGIQNLYDYIDFCKDALCRHPEWSIAYGFDINSFPDTNSYTSIDQFYKDVEMMGYKVTFDNIKDSYINEKVTNGELYLFQIYNKDFSINKKSFGNDNLHTSYWKLLFSEDNLKEVVLKLNGQAEVFFRQASLELTNEKKLNGYHAEELKDKFDYPIIKDKRFTEDKFFFHCPIGLNFKSPSIPGHFNEKIRKFLKDNPEVNIIGIDRGEKHLLYYYVIDQNANVIEQGTLNGISNGFIPQGESKERIINYHDKLHEIEKNRDKARKNWGVIENIKEMKAGYLSQVVHKLSKLIVKYNAIVVLEDLNQGFKRGRFGVEKQVYQKFEKALIDKLNYLCFKDKENYIQAGHYLNAYQLTNKFESFQKLGKQCGILFYTTASYTSSTDPVTGFLKNVYAAYGSVEKSVSFWKSFDSIIYNQDLDRFEFSYSLGSVHSKSLQRESGENNVSQQSWTVCSCVTRSRYVKKRNPQTDEQKQDTTSEQIGNKGMHETFFVTDEIKETLDKYEIDYKSNHDIKSVLLQKADKKHAGLHKSMIYLFNSIMSMRVTDSNSESGSSENDFIFSPVEPFFDSRKQYKNLPDNGDANGAYNIARKGICILNKINEADDLSRVDLLVTKQNWQNYVQDPDIVQAQIGKMTKTKI